MDLNHPDLWRQRGKTETDQDSNRQKAVIPMDDADHREADNPPTNRRVQRQ